MNIGKLKILTSVFDNLSNFLMLKKVNYMHGLNPSFIGKVHIHGSGKLILGDNVKIVSDDDMNPSDGSPRTHLSIYPDAVLSVGNNSGLSNCAITARESIVIKENVNIGSGCMIADNDFHSLLASERMAGDNNIKCKPVVIESGVFVGARCIILKGVTIGENSVIGAGSVVTKNIPANEIWAGNPAKFIKRLDLNI